MTFVRLNSSNTSSIDHQDDISSLNTVTVIGFFSLNFGGERDRTTKGDVL